MAQLVVSLIADPGVVNSGSSLKLKIKLNDWLLAYTCL